MVIKHIVLSGGAYTGLYELGALKYLSQRNFYDIRNIQSIHGTSIGGLIGVLLCMKMDWDTLDNYVINRPWYKIANVSPMMMCDILSKKGLLGCDFFKSALEPVLKSQHMNNNITLLELYERTHIDLNLYTIKLNSFELINLSHKTHPDMSLINAVHMTCCLPYIFQPVWYNNSYYIDGGLMNNYPIEKCIEDDSISKKEILGIKFNTTDSDVCGKLGEESNIFEYGYFLYKKLVKTHNIKLHNYHDHKNSIYELIIPCKELDVNDCYETIMNSEIRAKYIEDGVKYANVFYSYLERDNRLYTNDNSDENK